MNGIVTCILLYILSTQVGSCSLSDRAYTKWYEDDECGRREA